MKNSRYENVFVTTLRLLLGISLISALLLWQDNGTKVLALISELEVMFIPILLVLSLLLNTISAAKWGMLLRERGVTLDLLRLLRLYLIGKFFSNFMPSMVGGDVIRIAILGRYIKSYSQSAASVFLERFTGILALLSLAIVFALLNTQLLDHPLIVVTIMAVALACAGTIAIIFWSRLHSLFRWLAVRLPDGIRTKVENLFQEVLFFRSHPKALTIALLYSAAFYLVTTVSVYVACLSAGFDTDYLDVALVTPIIFLLTAIPVSPGNIGWWEWCTSILLVEIGATFAQGIMIGLILRFVALILSLVGGLFFVAERWHTSSDTET